MPALKLLLSSLVLLGTAACYEDADIGTTSQPLGYELATWNPAHGSNYSNGNRTPADIDQIIVHTTEGSYSGTQSWFKDPAANVSSHYIVRSSDGDITQMVDDSDYAWHVFCANERSIGIEHEGFVAAPGTWYTDEMYDSSARLSAWLANQYLIPIDRNHILGHLEFTSCTDHDDPGPGWDWDKYMGLIQQYATRSIGASLFATDVPVSLAAGKFEIATIDFINEGNYTWASDTVQLGTRESSSLYNTFWLSPTRVSVPKGSSNYPGEVVRFEVVLKGPAVTETTTFTETVQLIENDGNWFGPTVEISIEVTPDGSEPDPDPEPLPDPEGSTGGCTTAGQQGASSAAMLLLALFWRRRRRA